MSMRQKSGDEYDRSSVVVVAVKAAKEVSRTALAWALKNVVKPGDCVRLLVVIPTHASSKKLWGFPHFHNDCTTGYWRFMSGTILDQKEYFTDICNQIMCQLHHLYDAEKLWDMRNIMSPVKEFVGHSKGVIAMSWCPLDSSYMLTCAKDNRTICWDTN